MRLPKRVKLVEVGPRDGLQNEPECVPAEIRIELIERLVDAGLTVIEAGAFVSPARVPQMAATDRVLAGLSRRPGVRYPVLVPNRQGLEAALAAGARDIAVLAAASDTFSRRNIGCSIAESLEHYREACTVAREREMHIRGYVSCVLGCPFEGEVMPFAVRELAAALLAMGCEEIALGDTIGVGTPGKARALVEVVGAKVPVKNLACHFHDTYGQALANILAVLELGVAVFDSSVAGLGGCPFAPGAAGNVASEDLLYMLDGLGIETGVDLEKLAAAGRFICDYLGRPTGSKVAKALANRTDRMKG
ncbi:MAG TPA: hydroxymethylglutaryl-CoA lyase [Desulfuromonadales bacterium]|jgi:hydroxymethylglutaryl-CoA lyase